ncbi:M48 family metalloprotease [Marinoscillum pacificum]|uniref:M48 family metalloprotease n=1 Tax=Marinoscillum pacificum TaxID=392723 RepID=UPI0021573D94|nr:M48 family metalloprotease [Marinoscillum pacificum]
MKNFKSLVIFLAIGVLGTLWSCDKNGDIVLFSIENDKQLGAQVAAEIEADTSFTILSRAEYPEAYNYLQSMTDDILSSDEVSYRDEFAWEIHIIDDDVLNAFCTPGGYIYVYTGLIKYLENADDLAGVMGHEIAHADQRHSSKQLQRAYGIQILLSIALGEESSQLGQIVGQLAGTGATLAFSRSAESEADDFSVEYLADTDYACNGAASFFQKLLESGQSGGPEFLSTHPSPSTRVEDINAKADDLGCDKTQISESGFTYADFQNSLP